MTTREKNLKESAAQKKISMTEKRFQEIEEVVRAAKITPAEMLAWVEIDHDLGTFGGNHKFASEASS